MSVMSFLLGITSIVFWREGFGSVEGGDSVQKGKKKRKLARPSSTSKKKRVAWKNTRHVH